MAMSGERFVPQCGQGVAFSECAAQWVWPLETGMRHCRCLDASTAAHVAGPAICVIAAVGFSETAVGPMPLITSTQILVQFVLLQLFCIEQHEAVLH